MEYNMKYFILMSSFLLFAFSAGAEFNRQEKRPDYFIPEKEIVKTPVFVVDGPRRDKASSDTVAHISAKKNNNIANRAENMMQYTKTEVNDSNKISNNGEKPSAEMKNPRFQTVYDEYHNEILIMKKKGHLPENERLKDDLNKMSGDERFEVVD